MRTNTVVYLVLATLFAMPNLSSALPSPAFPNTHTYSVGSTNLALKIHDFHIKDVESIAQTTKDGIVSTLSFTFTDPNSNTSAPCTTTWTGLDHTPFGPTYTLCAPPKNGEFFAFHVNEYASPKTFSLALAHEFNDPAHYPPPYSQVEYFATSVPFALTCSRAAAGVNQMCQLPKSQSLLRAPVDAIAN